MYETEWDQAVEKLLELTRAEKLHWNVAEGFRRDGLQQQAYVTYVRGRKIAVYEYQHRYYVDEDDWEWRNDVAIEFIDEDGTLQWRWPKTALRWRLLDAVRFQLANASDFIKEFLAAESPA